MIVAEFVQQRMYQSRSTSSSRSMPPRWTKARSSPNQGLQGQAQQVGHTSSPMREMSTRGLK